MNSGPIVFLGGPIQHCVAPSETFEPAFRRLLQALIEALEAHGFRVSSAHRFECFGEMDVAGQELAVCRRDFAWMNSANIFVCVLPSAPTGGSVRSDGTCVELGWASALGKPILMVLEETDNHSHLINGLGAVADVTVMSVSLVREQPCLLAATARRMWERMCRESKHEALPPLA